MEITSFETAIKNFLDKYIQETAQAAHDAAAERIAGGAERNAVLAEYLSDAAFDSWYEKFVSNLQSAAGI